MKKYLLFLVALMLSTVVNAQFFEYKGIIFSVISEEEHTARVDINSQLSGDIIIPATAINGETEYSVTIICDRAFNDCPDITSVTIPNSVSLIGWEVFEGCEKLTSIVVEEGNSNFSSVDGALLNFDKTILLQCPAGKTEYNIPTSVTNIGAYAFDHCSKLTSVTLPESVTEIREYAFNYCINLAKIIISDSVTKIGDVAFAYCSSLTAVTIPKSVSEIGISVFFGCSSLTSFIVEDGNNNYVSENGVLFNKDKTLLIQCPVVKTEYVIPDNVTEIGDFAFQICSSLTSITIPDSVTKIGAYAFRYCDGLTTVYIPNSVTIIGESAFESCSSLTSVDIPDSVTEIGAKAFMQCDGLTSITISNSVTEIAEGTFNHCEKLTSVTIPNSVTEIGMGAFSGCRELASINIPSGVKHMLANTFSFCSKLKTIYNQNPVPQSVDEHSISTIPRDATIYVPKGSASDYFSANYWKRFSDIREMGALDVALSEQMLELAAGETATITTTVMKDDDMTVTSEEWSSSKSAVATVDNGVITCVAPGEAVIYFTAVDGYGVPHTASCKVTVIENSGVGAVVSDANASVDVFNLQGLAVLRNASATELKALPAGLYIVRQGKNIKKIIVK